MATLEGQTIAGSYKDLLQVSNSNSGVDGTLRSIEDGEGTASVLKISSSAVEITDGAYDFDVASHDGTNGLKLGGTLVTSSATELNLLDGITTLSGSNTGDQATGISDGNVLVANAAVADNDFLKIDGTSVEGRTVAEVLSDLSVESGADVTDTTNVTAAGALMDSEVTNLATVKALATGISDGNFLTANAAVADNDFLRIDGTEVEGRTAAEVAADIEGSIDAVGTLASGAISSGFGNIDIGSSTFDTTGAVTTGALTVGGNIDFNSGTIDTSTQTVTVELNQAADSFTFDGASDNILSIDASSNRVGIGTAAPDFPFHVETSRSGNNVALIKNTHASNGYGLKVFAGDDANVKSFEVGNYAGGNLFYIKGNGDAVLTGDLIMADGKGIDFAAMTSPADAAGMAAETLTDYEEGVHAVTIGGATVGLDGSKNSLQYTKIGRLVTLSGEISITSISSNTNVFTVSLPFTVADIDDLSERFQGTFSVQNCNFSGDYINIGSYAAQDTLKCQITNANGAWTYLNTSTMGATTEFVISVQYIAA